MTLPNEKEKAAVVEAMFDRIAPHYDRMNRLLTFGLDQIWRRRTLERIRLQGGDLVLDVACGTGDFAEMCRGLGARVVATDYAARMLDHAAARGMPGILVRSDAMSLPMKGEAFDAVVCGFALRNFARLQPAFDEMARVLRPGGRVGLLEVDKPANALIRFGHSVYFDRIVPKVGSLLADAKAYSYLPESAVYLPPWPKMKAMLEKAGFADVRHESAMLGAVQIVTGVPEPVVNGAAARIRRVLLAEHAVADPLTAIELAPGEPAFYWRSDERDVEIAALGAVATIDASGPDRFAQASKALAVLRESVDDSEADAGIPLAVGGFAFDDQLPSAPWEGFPALRFFVPRVLWIRRGGERRMVVAHPAGREQTPRCLLADALLNGNRVPLAAANGDDGAAWRQRVDSAVEAIREGRIEKIVLARRRTVEASSSPPTASLLRSLAESRPSCFTFLVRWSGRTFLGSSPERLLRLQAGDVAADALAGTAPRGLSKAHDEALARELVASAKERREHRIVADAIREALSPLAHEVHCPDEPVLVRLPEAHHLHTPVSARLASPGMDGLFDVAARLHPTPAVCGAPREAAFRQLAREEGDRGWYGGAVGWVTSHGDGELAVALRAALLDERSAHVWAGAGIVEGSSPEREFDETERKMRSILPFFEPGNDECAA